MCTECLLGAGAVLGTGPQEGDACGPVPQELILVKATSELDRCHPVSCRGNAKGSTGPHTALHSILKYFYIKFGKTFFLFYVK